MKKKFIGNEGKKKTAWGPKTPMDMSKWLLLVSLHVKLQAYCTL